MTYIGRFAPSPTGPLHFGSILTAIASFLDARANAGKWLVRIEDIDTPRVMAGASEEILHTLRAFGMQSDEEVVFQHQQTEYYLRLLNQLKSTGHAYGCQCSRKEIAEIAHAGIEGPVYPGTCRSQNVTDIRAWRFHFSEQTLGFTDGIQGKQTYQPQTALGDYVLYRADGLVAYQLAVVADDEAAGITHILRGMDLIHSTPRQIALQTALGFRTPHYAHLPIVVARNGQKLSKQNLAPAVNPAQAISIWLQVLALLGQRPPPAESRFSLENLIAWSIANWNIAHIPATETIPYPE